jgi:hypothetical protein
VIPSFRTDIKAEGFKFNFGDKLAPRFGLSYDVRGDGRFKVYGNWGRYFDWTKYELSRGGFGGDIWRVQYRSLDTTDAFSLSGTNLPGRNLWTPEAGSFRDLRIPNFDTVDPNLKPMSQDALNAGFEYQLKGNQTVTVNYTHSNLRRTIEDLGVLENGSEVYKYVNPGEGIADDDVPSGMTPPFARPKPKRPVRRARALAVEKRFSNNWFGSAATSTAASTATTRPAKLGRDSRRRDHRPQAARRSSRRQHRRARAAAPTGRGTSTSCSGTRTGNSDVLGRLATDRPHAVKTVRLLHAADPGRRWARSSTAPAALHEHDVVDSQRHPAVRGWPRQPRPDAGADPDRPAGLARPEVRLSGPSGMRLRSQRDQRLHTDDRTSHLRQS